MKKVRILLAAGIAGICFTAVTIAVLISSIILFGCCIDLQKGSNSLVTETDTQEQSAETTGEEKEEQNKDIDGTGTGPDSDSGSEAESSQEEIKNSFDSMMDGGASTLELFDFISQNLQSADKETATYIVGEVIRLSEEQKFDFTDKFADSSIQEKIYSELGESYEPDMKVLEQTDDSELKALIDETIARKFKILSVEGFFMPVVDYSAYKIYYDYISDELVAFIEIYLDESTRPAVLDAGIVIDMDEFVARIDKAFKYLDDFPDSPRYTKVSDFNSGRLEVYLGGIDNTMVFDISGNIYPDRLSEFENFAQDYEGTRFGDILKSYLELLEQEGYKKTAAVEEFLQNL